MRYELRDDATLALETPVKIRFPILNRLVIKGNERELFFKLVKINFNLNYITY